MFAAIVGRFRDVPIPPEIEVTPDHVKERIAEEQAEMRRELARLQTRAMRLAIEYRQRGESAE
jgi:hypothetical protein